MEFRCAIKQTCNASCVDLPLALRVMLHMHLDLQATEVKQQTLLCRQDTYAHQKTRTKRTNYYSAGYETTSMALTYALYELSRSPVMQQRLVDEVDRFGREKEPAFADLAQFPFADAVLKEGMRLHPPVTPLIGLVG